MSLGLAGPLSVVGRSPRLYFLQEFFQDRCHLPTSHFLDFQPESVLLKGMGWCEIRISSSVLPQACAPLLLCPELPKVMSLSEADLPPPLCPQSSHAGKKKAIKPWSAGKAKTGPLGSILPALVTGMAERRPLLLQWDH